MVRIIENQNDSNVLGFEIRGKVAKDDVEQVEKAIERKLESNDKVRLFTEIRDHDGWTFTGFFKDMTQKIKYAGKIEKAAIIADESWETPSETADLFTSGDVERFSISESDRAKQWVKGPNFSNKSTAHLHSNSNISDTAPKKSINSTSSEYNPSVNTPNLTDTRITYASSLNLSDRRTENQSYSSKAGHIKEEIYSDTDKDLNTLSMENISYKGLTQSNDLTSTEKSKINQTNTSERQYSDNSQTRTRRDFTTSSNPDASYQERYSKVSETENQFSANDRASSDLDSTFGNAGHNSWRNDSSTEGYNSGTSYTGGQS